MREEIINKIITDNSFKKYCFYLCKGNEIHQDLYQQAILIVLELPEERLIKINEGNLKGYLMRLIYTSFVNSYSEFNKQIKSCGEDLTHDLFSEPNDSEIDFELINKSIDDALIHEQKYWDKRGQPSWTGYLFEEYVKDPNYLELSRKINIPYPTIRYNITKIIKRINENINNNRQ